MHPASGPLAPAAGKLHAVAKVSGQRRRLSVAPSHRDERGEKLAYGKRPLRKLDLHETLSSRLHPLVQQLHSYAVSQSPFCWLLYLVASEQPTLSDLFTSTMHHRRSPTLHPMRLTAAGHCCRCACLHLNKCF